MTFILTGAACGFAVGTIGSVMDVIGAIVKQMNTMGYIVVLSFVAYNALSLLPYSGLGTLLAQLGANGLIGPGLSDHPLSLLLAFLRRYVPRFRIGEMVIMMFPYSLCFLIASATLLVGWVALGIPLGF